jgi:hypothetical protein
MHSRVWLLALAICAAAAPLEGQGTCDPATIELTVDTHAVPNGGYDVAGTRVDLVDRANPPNVKSEKLTQPSGADWSPTKKDIDFVRGVAATHQLRWTKGDDAGVFCLQSFGFGIGETASPVSNDLGQPSMSECQQMGKEWAARLGRETKAQRQHGFTEIVFMEDTGPCFWNRDYGVQGDPIYVGVYTKTGPWKPATFEPCAAEPEAPSLFLSSGIGALSGLSGGRFQLIELPPRRCWNSAVDVSVSKAPKAGEDEHTSRYGLSQSGRYRGTVQLGVLFTELHEQTFGLRTTDSARIFSKGPTSNGPDYVASVVIYSLPRYFINLFSGRLDFGGRDILHDQTILDRIGGVVGVGLKNPGRRFVFGFSFEALYGVNAIAAWDRARIPVLAPGLSEGSAFTGAESEIPTVDDWKTKFEFGFSMDLRYVMALFTRQ